MWFMSRLEAPDLGYTEDIFKEGDGPGGRGRTSVGEHG